MRNIAFSAIIMLTIINVACNKHDEIDPSVTPDIKAIITTSPETAAGGGTVYTLNVLEKNGTVRWQKQQWGFFHGFEIGSGLLFVTGSAPVYSGGKFGVYDMVTGSELWSKNTPNDDYYEVIVRKDTLFCSEEISNSGTANGSYIGAYNAKTGALYWKTKTGNLFFPYNLILEDNILYFITSEPPNGSGGKLTAFNINTQTLAWSVALNLSYIYGGVPMYSFGNKLIIKGLQVAKGLYSIEKSNGAIYWSKPTKFLTQQLFIQDGATYGVCELSGLTTDIGLYAYDCTTGDQKWFTAMPGLYTGSFLATSKAGLFMVNSDSNGDYIKGFNLSTGTQTWSTRAGTNDFLGFPLAMGNRVYTYNHRLNGLQTIQPRIVSYDAATGQPKDSVNLPSGMNSPYRLVTSYN